MAEERRVRLTTSYGEITLELFTDKTPATAENFLRYVRDGFYDRTLFHRVIHDFVIQTGGFSTGMVQKTTRPPILNESAHAPRNARGTVAVARLPEDCNSGTAQFFINTRDNEILNYRDDTPEGCGYCVFGRVVDGMEVVDKISGVITVAREPHQNVPITEVQLVRAEIVP